MAKLTPLLSPSAFDGLEGYLHLCTGGEAPWLRSQAEVYETFVRWKTEGKQGRERIYDRGERCRARVGQLWGVAPERIALLPSAAEGMAWLARGLDWCPGDNVVVPNLEFPSVAYAWRNLAAVGVEVRFVPHSNWEVVEEDLIAAIDDRTRVVAVSQVSFYTGQCLDVLHIADAISRRPIPPLFAVDATHASGVVQVPAGCTDLCVSSSYKWMLATHGIAPCYLSDRAEQQVRSSSYGWHNLQVWPPQGAERTPWVEEQPMPARMEPGNPAMVVAMFLDHSVQVLLDIGIQRIEGHARNLSQQISDGLRHAGHTVISPERVEGRSGNTCFLVDDAESVQRSLEQRGVLVWGEYGRVRVSGHLYNSGDDIERFLQELSEVV